MFKITIAVLFALLSLQCSTGHEEHSQEQEMPSPQKQFSVSFHGATLRKFQEVALSVNIIDYWVKDRPEPKKADGPGLSLEELEELVERRVCSGGFGCNGKEAEIYVRVQNLIEKGGVGIVPVSYDNLIQPQIQIVITHFPVNSQIYYSAVLRLTAPMSHPIQDGDDYFTTVNMVTLYSNEIKGAVNATTHAPNFDRVIMALCSDFLKQRES